MPKVIIDGRWRVFLSSTFRELEEYRREVRQQCKQNLRQQIDLVALDDEQYSRHSLDAGLLSAEKVKSCDLVLLLIGRELGSRSASGESYTEIEIKTARENGIPVMPFVLAESAEGSGRTTPADLAVEDAKWWDREREQLFRDSVVTRSWVYGPFDISETTAAQLAGEVVKGLGEWLGLHARPHRLLDSKAFVDRERPYRELKDRVLQGLTSVVSGPSGTGKSTLTEALNTDQDVAREYALPAIKVALDLTVPSQKILSLFRQKVESGLADAREKSPSGARFLLVVSLSAVLATVILRENEAGIRKFIREYFGPDAPVVQDCTPVFEVPERSAASRICRYLDADKGMHITVPNMDQDAAVELLLVMDGLRYGCSGCASLAPAATAAAGRWPPLLALCASALAEKEHPDEQHKYLQHAGQVFNELLTDEEQRYETFKWQKGLLAEKHKQAHDVLEMAGVLLPSPFVFSQDLIQAISGLSKQAARRALETLADREFLKRVVRPERASRNAGPEYTVHPFFWLLLQQQLKEQPAGNGAARGRAKQFRDAAFTWLDLKINEAFDDELTYQGWFELEKPERQSLIANWVYQLAHLDDRRQAAEELARIFLKAQWWWGYYLPFGFCELLNELGSKAVNWSSSADEDDDDDDLSVVVQALRTFYDRYPRGGLFDDPPKAAKAREAWQQTTQALVDIATCLEIPVNDDVATVQSQMTAEAADTAALPDEERRDKTRRNNARWEIAKLLHIFLSDCEQCSFGGVPLDDQALQEVERHCGLALVIADHQGDDWNQPWVLSELGDAELAAARARRQSPDAFRRNEAACLQEARANAEEALELARQQGEEDDDELDFEILSICERLLGDIDWYTGDQEPAVQHYARAVHYAQCFEVWPGHQPDRYTWTFEREQRWRVSTPLLELADESGDDAVPRALCAQIAGFFGTDPGFAWEHLTKALREQQPHQAGAAVNALFAPYHLPPADDLEGRDEKSRNLVDDFRRDAANMIRATEQRHPDLVRLPSPA